MRKVTLPLSSQDVQSLRAFDQVLLSGELYVGRDQVHSRLVTLLDNNEPLPFSLSGQTMYYMGPSPAPNGHLIGSCGPTTSARMDAFSPRLLDLGLKAMVGKGPRSKAVVDSIVKNQAVYLQAFGGCGALYASTVTKVETIAFSDLGPEALLRLTVENFPVIVAIDCFGGSVYSL
ncbi:hydro-lyase family enzyme, Fe-S type, tartrate/fumarate subfamily [Sphaerochaeta pleomorpha str. Grapes]|uniref:Hydro-lyase family enzyme, Fe-S type, tartrate/fumarate subfamily n=1 Tax=Sphaerochaeta pleomorpha (strain ATCC BAA-1885 / DSM 22778 / Grapes) TaxID=158190 RepID=G8QU27_SPHPG|nr:FumA C-terminus/TtdB family hydratase beta subunit [Sphaerochaeta pleomorpha]AEV30274.1 hydro-lyase family enzyme, Fe-S type, tartrate/fumarate subfamily [Sphaerochaeta pleomorpha str. Grapes]